MPTEKVWCKNLLCRSKPFKLDLVATQPIEKQLKIGSCKHCGNVGLMLEKDKLTKDEIMDQVNRWGEVVLYKKAFKVINYKKLPNSITKQKEKRNETYKVTEQKTTAPIRTVKITRRE